MYDSTTDQHIISLFLPLYQTIPSHYSILLQILSEPHRTLGNKPHCTSRIFTEHHIAVRESFGGN